MPYYEMMPAGLPAGLQTGMDAVLNKKMGTAGSYPPGTWPDTVNLMGPLPEKTVSGAVAVIEDGADDVPTSSVKVSIPANLDGVSGVTVMQTGKNILPLVDGTYTVRPNTTAVVSEGTITINGTPASSGGRTVRLSEYFVIKKGVTYRLSPDSETPYCRLWINKKSDNAQLFSSGSGNYTPTEDIEVYMGVAIQAETYSNFTVSPMLAISSTSVPYEPYISENYTASLGRTIYGGVVDLVNGTGNDSHVKVKFSDLDWRYYTEGQNPIFYAYGVPNEKVYSRGELPSLIIDGYTTTTANARSNLARYLNDMECSAIENGTSLALRCDSITSVEDLISAYGNNYVVYEVDSDSSVDFTFTGQEVDTLLGYNAFLSVQGDTEVTYRRDIDLALGGN